MTKTLITLPCTAQELENALHAVCDHDGLWYETVCVGHDDKLGICLEISAEDETKGEMK